MEQLIFFLHPDTIDHAAEIIRERKTEKELADEFEQTVNELGQVEYFDVTDSGNGSISLKKTRAGTTEINPMDDISGSYTKNKVKLGQNIDINSGEFYYDLPKGLHRLKSGHRIHTKSSCAGKTWNKSWGEYIKAHPNATAEETLAHLRQLERDFDIVKYKARRGK